MTCTSRSRDAVAAAMRSPDEPSDIVVPRNRLKSDANPGEVGFPVAAGGRPDEAGTICVWPAF
jgi:hypothetical protein